jgi:CpeS-like protein
LGIEPIGFSQRDEQFMDIVAFFQQSAGRWSSIKSNHHVDTTQQQSGRSTIEMTLVTPNDPAVLELCSKQGQDPSTVTSAAKLKWEGTMEGTTKQETNSGLIVAVGDPTQGQLLRTIGNFGTAASQGHYSFGDGGEFVLVSQDKDWVTTERVWFESDNVRLRHTKIQYPDGKNVVSFCSEVRVLPPKS